MPTNPHFLTFPPSPSCFHHLNPYQHPLPYTNFYKPPLVPINPESPSLAHPRRFVHRNSTPSLPPSIHTWLVYLYYLSNSIRYEPHTARCTFPYKNAPRQPSPVVTISTLSPSYLFCSTPLSTPLLFTDIPIYIFIIASSPSTSFISPIHTPHITPHHPHPPKQHPSAPTSSPLSPHPCPPLVILHPIITIITTTFTPDTILTPPSSISLDSLLPFHPFLFLNLFESTVFRNTLDQHPRVYSYADQYHPTFLTPPYSIHPFPAASSPSPPLRHTPPPSHPCPQCPKYTDVINSEDTRS